MKFLVVLAAFLAFTNGYALYGDHDDGQWHGEGLLESQDHEAISHGAHYAAGHIVPVPHAVAYPHPVPIPIPHPVPVPVAQPVAVPVPHAVPVPVHHEVHVPVVHVAHHGYGHGHGHGFAASIAGPSGHVVSHS